MSFSTSRYGLKMCTVKKEHVGQEDSKLFPKSIKNVM